MFSQLDGENRSQCWVEIESMIIGKSSGSNIHDLYWWHSRWTPGVLCILAHCMQRLERGTCGAYTRREHTATRERWRQLHPLQYWSTWPARLFPPPAPPTPLRDRPPTDGYRSIHLKLFIPFSSLFSHRSVGPFVFLSPQYSK